MTKPDRQYRFVWGNDQVDFRGGSLRGEARGGLGNDVLFTDKQAIRLVEASNEGTDTIKSTVSYTLPENVEILMLLGSQNTNGSGGAADNTLVGNIGKNLLSGLDGADTLDGGKGNDKLTGGLGIDKFGFATGYGKDKIMDFSEGRRDNLYPQLEGN